MSRTERPRDIALERQITGTVWQAAGLPAPPPGQPNSLDVYSDGRAHPGGLIVPRDWKREMREEGGDFWNYGKWDAVENYPGFIAGDPEACHQYEQTLRAMVHMARAWRELHTRAC